MTNKLEEKQVYRDELKSTGENWIKNYYKQAALDSVKYVRSVLGKEFDAHFDKRVEEINNGDY